MSRRARRWAWRNRMAVTAGAVALIAGVFGLLAVLAVQTRAKAELAAANGELNRSRAAVQARYDLAVDAIKTFHTGVSEDFLLKEEKFKGLRDRLLKSAADFYSKLSGLLGNETEFASRRALAASNFELAELTAKVGRLDEALARTPVGPGGARGAGSEPAADTEVKSKLPKPDRTQLRARDGGEERRGAGSLPPVGVAAGGRAGRESVVAGGAGVLPHAPGYPVLPRRPVRRGTGGIPAGVGRSGGGSPLPGGHRRGPREPRGRGQRHRRRAMEDEQATRGGGRAPEGAGDPSGAGRPSPGRSRPTAAISPTPTT